jgi:hypothetical protein
MTVYRWRRRAVAAGALVKTGQRAGALDRQEAAGGIEHAFATAAGQFRPAVAVSRGSRQGVPQKEARLRFARNRAHGVAAHLDAVRPVDDALHQGLRHRRVAQA